MEMTQAEICDFRSQPFPNAWCSEGSKLVQLQDYLITPSVPSIPKALAHALRTLFGASRLMLGPIFDIDEFICIDECKVSTEVSSEDNSLSLPDGRLIAEALKCIKT